MSVSKIYAVIDTNVIVSAMLTQGSGSAVFKVFGALLDSRIVPLYNEEILNEYYEVLQRPKFPFKQEDIENLVNYIRITGIPSERVAMSEDFVDKDDIVFYEISLSNEDAYLITGNLKHFPKTPKVVSPSQVVDILGL